MTRNVRQQFNITITLQNEWNVMDEGIVKRWYQKKESRDDT